MEVQNQEHEEQQVETPAPEPSLRDTVSAAFDAVAESEGIEPEEQVEQPAKPAQPRDEGGRFAPKGDEEKPEKPGQAPQPRVQAKPAPAPAKPGAAPDAQPPAKQVPDRAPQAWKALAREKWTALDKLGEEGKAIKEEIARREREVNQRLQQDAPARDLAQAFHQMVTPFLQYVPPGKNIMQSIHGLMQTAAVLQTGSPQQRATIAANIIRGYGVDIDMLAAALDGGSNVVGPGQRPAQGQGYDPRVDQLVAELRQRDAQQAAWQRQQEEAEFRDIEAGYEEFSKSHEFFEDVRGDMADIIRLKAGQGVAIDDETAYHMAVALHPEISEVLRAREAQAALTNPNGSTQRSRRAAVSIAPRPGLRTEANIPAEPGDVRSTVSAAWDAVQGRNRA